MCIKSVFESVSSKHNDIVRKAIPHVYDTSTEKILPQFVSNLLQLPLVKYSPVTFFGNVRATC